MGGVLVESVTLSLMGGLVGLLFGLFMKSAASLACARA